VDATSEQTVGICILGVIRVRTDTGWTPVAGTKLQALLAMLALSAPHPVSSDHLIDEVWGDQPPSKPENALQAQISQLRRLLGRERVTHEPAGYALTVAPDAIDACRLDRLVTAGRAAATTGDHQAAAGSFAAAVSLVHGPPLRELVDHRFAREAAARLEGLALDANECLVDALLASGGHADVVERLRDLVHAHPLRERFHAQLITALYRCGRQSDALRAYQDVRTTLAEELGIDPGPELQALERAVLSHDPALAAPIELSLAVTGAVLPVAMTSFVGRTTDIEQLQEAVAGARLVTVLGPGGVGKSRLALELATRLAPTREVWFVELAPITDPLAVAEAIASALGARDHADDAEGFRAPDVRIIDRIRDRNPIVVLDNCEHVLEAAATCVQTLLVACPRVTVVATSRAPLDVVGERHHVVTSLSDDDAVALFAERARAVQPHFGATDADGAVAALCHRLDGLPLAIELAAARTKTLPLPEITARLEDRFTLLRSTGRTGAGRHEGLGAAIAWSYDLLFEEERQLFRRLAVFAGGATVEAADAVCGHDALDLLTRLVDRSLLSADTSGATSRFRMLESLRAYGLDRLAEAGELEEALAAHVRWCIELAERAEPHLGGEDQLVWLDRIDAEQDNLRGALVHAATNDPNSGLRLIAALLLPWWFRGRRHDARHWLDVCLANAPDASAPIRIKALGMSGLLADAGSRATRPGGLETELELAERRQREAIALGEGIGRPRATMYARLGLIITLIGRSIAGLAIDVDELTDLVTRTGDDFEARGDDFGGGILRSTEAVGAISAGDLRHAAVATELARAHAARSGDRFTAARVEWLDGLACEEAGDVLGAYRHTERCVELLDQLGMGQAVTAHAALLVSLGDRSGRPEVADHWRAFVAGRRGGSDRDDITLIAAARNSAASTARAAGQLERARVAHEQALASYRESGVASGIAYTESCLGFLAAEVGDPTAAAAHHAAAFDAATTAAEPAALALALEGLASAVDEPDAEWAATMLGAATSLWRHSPARVAPTHRDDVAAVDARLRDRLGDDRFAAAVDRGSALELIDAIAAARARYATR
jgi:predicted ATPase/DNA-binding SARP family transcriptional activator